MATMKSLRIAIRTCLVAIGWGLAPLAAAGGFVDVLDLPAQRSQLATRSPMQAVTRAGNRLIAVGQRGHIVVSADAGATWRQASVPVSSDLTGVYFVDSTQGWVVGHDGVVLHTKDSGDTWQLQLDGRKANDLLVAAMTRKVAADGSDAAKKLLAEASRYQQQGADKPFLDVWFADANDGYVVGAYNLIFRTRDGGNTWESWFDRTENSKFFNLYAIRQVAGALYVAGEGGLVMKLDASGQRFSALAVPYQGSFFGLAAAKDAVLAFGLRGNVFRSEDGGQSWTKVDAQLPSAVVAATPTLHGATLLADAGGRVAASDDGGRTFTKVLLKHPMPIVGLIEAAEGQFVLAGPRGVAVTGSAAAP
jgi:photosystem II stability/assembly factor-like uncharacterized protein